jgi:hypothetical protein
VAAREAACHCGQLRVAVTGDPIRVSICHCLACQRRTGSVFGAQARFAPEQVQASGRSNEFVRAPDDGDGLYTFHFCPDCGSTVYYTSSEDPDLVAVAVGAFADPSFPPPIRSVWEVRQHAWVVLPDTIEEHYD